MLIVNNNPHATLYFTIGILTQALDPGEHAEIPDDVDAHLWTDKHADDPVHNEAGESPPGGMGHGATEKPDTSYEDEAFDALSKAQEAAPIKADNITWDDCHKPLYHGLSVCEDDPVESGELILPPNIPAEHRAMVIDQYMRARARGAFNAVSDDKCDGECSAAQNLPDDPGTC